ncbi:unnamed protein product [Bursaphelenchus xylophilus]|uniref:(pine wood nematode) hypothetical protein n=1 Tax=Bursaphelenchus xylophilus TaxID=6326 RepID=A0A1I7RJB1_BURXY|nr:unnamed protein product [Bursaphelenchus xylophilus]CAG9128755.1 unnamed protein product [Bursaphelenchus xylophilus]
MRRFSLTLLCLLVAGLLSQPIPLDDGGVDHFDHSVPEDVATPTVARVATTKIPLTFEELLNSQHIEPIIQASLVKVETPEEAAELAFALEQAAV